LASWQLAGLALVLSWYQGGIAIARENFDKKASFLLGLGLHF
jgi:hypothetical protein